MDFRMIFQAALFLATPAVAVWLVQRSKLAEAVGPVAICYAIGIGAGNLPGVHLDSALSMNMGGLAVILAIPMLLFSVDVVAWLSSARATVIASLIAFMTTAVVATTVGVFFYGDIAFSHYVAAALSAVYSGGTANMVAVSRALNFPPELFVAINMTDVVISGPYYLVLVSIGVPMYGLFLKPPAESNVHHPELDLTEQHGKLPKKSVLAKGFALTVAIAALSFAAAQLFPAGVRDLLMVVFASTLGIAASFVRPIRQLPGTYAVGEFVLFIFCVSIGSLADFSTLAQADPRLLLFTASVFFGSQAFQLLFFRLFGIDRDTAMMATVASVYSPPFVAPVAAKLRSKDALFTGVSIGLMGYAVAVYIGLAVAWMVPRLAQ